MEPKLTWTISDVNCEIHTASGMHIGLGWEGGFLNESALKQPLFSHCTPGVGTECFPSIPLPSLLSVLVLTLSWSALYSTGLVSVRFPSPSSKAIFCEAPLGPPTRNKCLSWEFLCSVWSSTMALGTSVSYYSSLCAHFISTPCLWDPEGREPLLQHSVMSCA